MELMETITDCAVVLRLQGKMDAITTPDFIGWFDSRNGTAGGSFVVDCSELIYLSSAGLRGFLMVAKKIKAGDGRLVVCGLSGVVQEVFRISGFLTILDTCPDLEDALKTLRS